MRDDTETEQPDLDPLAGRQRPLSPDQIEEEIAKIAVRDEDR